ncbi:MAG: hypothetical protein MUE44_15170 [Oscillatoriaceae cyanobacterium Prado104]|jgi:phycoerythrin-associated linker protein|nr:hypothetical protein [Oscillatoriaceae cyanobacterium Prado104]
MSGKVLVLDGRFTDKNRWKPPLKYAGIALEKVVKKMSIAREIAAITSTMLPPIAEKKLQCWIRSRHIICSGNFFIFETVNYSAIERFSDCIAALGGTIISVNSVGKIWMGNHRQVILYRAKASLHAPHHDLKQYWIKYGSFRTRFDPQV